LNPGFPEVLVVGRDPDGLEKVHAIEEIDDALGGLLEVTVPDEAVNAAHG
jgi:2,3-bisphosphoglycerate-independent phosphoglycerate mutase